MSPTPEALVPFVYPTILLLSVVSKVHSTARLYDIQKVLLLSTTGLDPLKYPSPLTHFFDWGVTVKDLGLDNLLVEFII